MTKKIEEERKLTSAMLKSIQKDQNTFFFNDSMSIAKKKQPRRKTLWSRKASKQ